MENIIYKNDRIVLFAKYGDPDLHRHFAKHILVSNKPFVRLINNKESVARSAIIQSQTVHSIKKDAESKMVVFFIDETSALSKKINHMYLDEKIENQLPLQLENYIVELIDNSSSLDEIDKLIINHFQKEEINVFCLDDRILSVLKYIDESQTLNQEIYDTLSKSICLSKSRLLHLFKENMGIDMKNYLLIKRMEKTYQYVTKNNMTITEAAIMSGFSSSSHFSEACKQHYGISLTDFLKALKI